VIESAFDDLLEEDPGRKIHLLGYSLGALIAVNFAFPRTSLSQPVDIRHRESLASCWNRQIGDAHARGNRSKP
jgi:hypothetical protein